MTVGRVVMGLPRNLSPLGTKNAPTALFAAMSKSPLRICPNRLSRMVIEISFSFILYVEICLLFYWVFDDI